MGRLLLLFLSALMFALPASAHSLRVFARVEGTQVSGYAFFIGGGRPAGVAWSARMGGESVASGTTDAAGGYGFTMPVPVTADVAITVDTGEGHIATTTLSPARFGAAAQDVAAGSTPPAPDRTAPATNAQETARLVEAAVERQVAPLLERIEAMDARIRFTDAISGIFLIVGLAGLALWARSRTR